MLSDGADTGGTSNAADPRTFSQAMRSVCGVLNTHFLTGSTITTAPASEMNGMPACSASGTAAGTTRVASGSLSEAGPLLASFAPDDESLAGYIGHIDEATAMLEEPRRIDSSP